MKESRVEEGVGVTVLPKQRLGIESGKIKYSIVVPIKQINELLSCCCVQQEW